MEVPPDTEAIALPELEPQDALVGVTEMLSALGWEILTVAVPEQLLAS